jgi:hypothetical protein
MNQSDTWQYSTRVNPLVTSADGHLSEFSAPDQSFMDRDLESRDDSSPDSRDARSRFNRGPLDQEDTW